MYSKKILAYVCLAFLLFTVVLAQRDLSVLDKPTFVINEALIVQDGRVVFEDFNSNVNFQKILNAAL